MILQEEKEEERISIAWCLPHVRLGNRGLSAGGGGQRVCVCVSAANEGDDGVGTLT